ncbi:hypothetical protein OGAPHI_007257 [Ogataea philodendri]|uniref:non-specific serine/threonine protein kinase n=1 Tax=Ogataea philodendri TaxID=1378263 RepID=A0A9P8NVC0_9ASCO|nr:uncharacterized protein OGAPHI_007257 [Ogataea philodendri]KAH3660052.1 hypothetical protein OGAPHI_007257 [Ogataea philodendri]
MQDHIDETSEVRIKVPQAREFTEVQNIPSADYLAQSPAIDSTSDQGTIGSTDVNSSWVNMEGGVLHVKKLREPGNVPSVAHDRVVSEMRMDDRRDFSLNIEPVQRIVSVPLRPPVLQQKAFSLNSTDSIDEEAEPADEAAPSFVTIDSATRLKQHWTCNKDIGKGTFSTVYLDTTHNVAIKVSNIPTQDQDTKVRIQSSLIRELSLLQLIHHPNIVKLLGSNSRLERNQVIMAMPYYRGGDLFSLLVTLASDFNYNHKRLVFRNIVSAVKCLHDMNICHRDIKLENVLLAPTVEEFRVISFEELAEKYNENLAVLSDFGLSKKIDPENPLLTTRCGSEDYVSPELLLGLAYDGKQNDCWSLGVLLYAMLENRLPFDPLPNSTGRGRRSAKPTHRIATITWSWNHLKDSDLDPLGNDWGPAKRVVEQLLVKRDRRADISTIHESDWCKGIVCD